MAGQVSSIDLAQQYTSTDNYQARFNLYGYAQDKRDMHTQIIAEVVASKYKPRQRVLDIGSGDLKVLRSLADQTKAILTGVDLFPRDILETDRFDFFVSSATDLPFIPTSSIDCVLALFMLYHVASPSQALEEFHRILKPNARLIVAMSGPGNKMRHHAFEQDLAVALHCQAPSAHTAAFSPEKAKDLLPEYFNIERHVSQITEMRFTEATLPSYVASLSSMWETSLGCSALAWNNAIQNIVMPKLLTEIAKKGYFWDRIERHYFICERKH